MAVAHYQFESIHPFYDGNGRTGRILNVLYLVKEGLIDSPILYLSRHIIREKAEYYRLLQSVRSDDDWESWALFILRTSMETASVHQSSIDGAVAAQRLMEASVVGVPQRLWYRVKS